MSLIAMTTPKYEVTLPISGLNVTYRPFVVREEKVLLLALEENTTASITLGMEQILNACTFEKHSIDTLNKVDAEYLFIKIRNKSMGEGVDVTGKCKSCEKKTNLTLNFDDVKVTPEKLPNSTFQINDDTWITMKLPSMRTSLELDSSNDEMAYALTLDTLIVGEESFNMAEFPIKDRLEFIENLTTVQLNKLSPFFETFPMLTYDLDFNCVHCKEKNHIHIEGLENFFV